MSSTTQIAESLGKIFDLFVRIGYIPADSVRVGPHDDADLDIDLLRRLGMNDTAIGFIKSIPWVVDQPVDLIVNSEAMAWQEPWDLRSSRKLSTDNGGVSFRVDTSVNGSWLSLTIPVASNGKSRRGHLLVIDTAHGTVRQWDGIDRPRLQDVPGEPAHFFFNRVYQRYHSLEQIPYKSAIFEPITLAEHPLSDAAQNAVHTNAYRYLKVAAEESRWPNPNFSTVDFSNNATHYLGDLIRKHRNVWRAPAPSHLIDTEPLSDDDDEEEEEEEEEEGEGGNGLLENGDVGDWYLGNGE